MAHAYNKEHPEDAIQLNEKLNTLNPAKYKRILLETFRKKLERVCDNQRCWVKQNFIKNMESSMRQNLKKDTFRPPGPQGKFDWLNTFNINEVMTQYESKFKDFKFLGAVPIDFDELPSLSIKDLNFEELEQKGIKRIGIVYNLDEHDKSGSHWVSGFADLGTNRVYYFDSYGLRPEPRIRAFMRRIAKYLEQKKSSNQGGGRTKIDVRSNEIRHQFGDNACGVYSINFILRLLHGESFDVITKNITRDEEVNKFRDVYFT